MNRANDGSLNRHGGHADMESNADAAARERAVAVEDRMRAILDDGELEFICPECDWNVHYSDLHPHIATCELLRERAEREVSAAERDA